MILQLNPPLNLITPKGRSLCHFVIDYGPDADLIWVCAQQETGEMWCWNNKNVRLEKNITEGRLNISPFYDQKDVAFKE